MLIGRERQDVGRPGDAGYPVRRLVTAETLYLENFAPDRWPTGNPETGCLDCDASPTKTLILGAHRRDPADRFWQSCFGRRGPEELYDLRPDPDCLTNLVAAAAAEPTRAAMRSRLHAELQAQQDPRMAGGGDVFDQYLHASPDHVRFHERFRRGEPLKAGWVNPTDFEPAAPPPPSRP